MNPAKGNYFLRQLHEEDRFVLSKLRRDVMAGHFSYVQEKTGLNWGPSDRVAFVYGVFHDEKLISTLRLDQVTDIEVYEARIQASFSFIPSVLPVSVTCRAATDPNYQKLGVHSILKMACLMKAMSIGYEFCFAAIKSTSFQIDAFHRIGYDLIPSDREWRGFLGDIAPPVVGRLNLKTTGKSAVQYLAKRNSDMLKQTTWCQQFLQELSLDHRSQFLLEKDL